MLRNKTTTISVLLKMRKLEIYKKKDVKTYGKLEKYKARSFEEVFKNYLESRKKKNY